MPLPPRGSAGPPCQGPGQHSPPPRLMSRHPDLRGPSDSASRGKAPEWEGGGSSAGQRAALGRKERERQRESHAVKNPERLPEQVTE